MSLKRILSFNYINVSRLCNWIIILFIAFILYRHKDWNNPDKIIQNDVISYYLYLPATFIYEDITLQYAKSAPESVKSKIWSNESPIHIPVSKMSCGLSMLFCPFFLVSHWYALSSDYPADGYSLPYRFGLITAALVFLGIGLYYLRKTLNQFFPGFITAICSLLLVFGTNLYFYSVYEPTMTHVFNFALIMAFIYYSIRWNKNKTIALSLMLGLLIGLISLVRPTNFIIVLFLFFWDIKSLHELKEKTWLWIMKFHYLLIIAVVAFIIWIPQLLYWKITTGSYLYYSYQDEHFFFNDPVIMKGLFGFRKGWLLYTPIMIFSFAGIFLLRKKLPSFFFAVLIYVVLNTFIILSWWCWWYGGSFGARAFIDSYGLMAIPLGTVLLYLWNERKTLFFGLIVICSFLTYFNQFQTRQYIAGSLHWDAMTKEAYWNNFLSLHVVGNYEQLLDHPDYQAAKKGIR